MSIINKKSNNNQEENDIIWNSMKFLFKIIVILLIPIFIIKLINEKIPPSKWIKIITTITSEFGDQNQFFCR